MANLQRHGVCTRLGSQDDTFIPVMARLSLLYSRFCVLSVSEILLGYEEQLSSVSSYIVFFVLLTFDTTRPTPSHIFKNDFRYPSLSLHRGSRVGALIMLTDPRFEGRRQRQSYLTRPACAPLLFLLSLPLTESPLHCGALNYPQVYPCLLLCRL